MSRFNAKRGACFLAFVLLLGAALVAGSHEAHASEPAPWARLSPGDIVAAPRLQLESPLQRGATASPLSRVSPRGLAKAQWVVCDPCKRERRWEILLGPYGWLAGVHGTAWAEGTGRHFEIDFDTLKEFASGGFMFYAEFRYDKWFLAFDGTWATLESDFSRKRLSGGFRTKQRILELRAGYRVFGDAYGKPCDCTCAPCAPPRSRRLSMDAYVGARYWDNETTVRVKLGPLETEKTSSDDWFDPFVGVRFGYKLAPRWTMDIRADVGGFGIGDASDFAYNTFLGFGWHFAKHWTLMLGWRTQGTDRVKPREPSVRAGVDIHQTGPLIGLLWHM